MPILLRPRSTCCRASCALPSRFAESPARHIRWRGRPRHGCRSAISARMMSLTACPGQGSPRAPPASTSACAGAAFEWRTRTRIRWRRCRRQAPRRHMSGGVMIATGQRDPGKVKPSSGPITWTMPWRPVAHRNVADAEPGRVLLPALDSWRAASPSGSGRSRNRGRHGMVGDERGARQGRAQKAPLPRRPGRRRPAGSSTSCTRCRSI